MAGEYTYQEIMSQPEAWHEALGYIETQARAIKAIRLADYDEVIFTGCGSTYYLAVAAATLMRESTGMASRGLPASEIWLYAKAAYNQSKNTLLIAVSRSGTTTETLRAVESFKANAKGTVLTLTCYPESTLATSGQSNLVFRSGQEQSIAQTRAFTVLYLATVALIRLWTNQDISALYSLSEICGQILTQSAGQVKRLGTDARFERFYFLGSGARYGLACELSLKMKEMTLSHSEPFHFLEFRHGPQSMANENTLMIGLISEQNSAAERAVLEEMKARGAHVLGLANHNADITFASQLETLFHNVLYLPAIQLMAFERSLSKGLDPDKPLNLTAVVILD